MSGGEIALLRLVGELPVQVQLTVILAEDGPLVAALARAGVTVEVLPIATAGREIGRDGTRPVAIVVATWHLLRYAFALRTSIARLAPDVIHTNTIKAGIYGSLAGRLTGVPVLWHLRDRLASDYMPRSSVTLLRALMTVLPRAVIVNSAATAATLGPARRRLVAVLPDPYRPKREVTQPPNPHHGQALRFLVVGRLTPWKGQAVAVRALAASGLDQATLTLVGAPLFNEEAYAADLAALVLELGLVNRVRLLGHRDDVEGELAAADVVVHCSTIPEPFGQVVVEAMAAGRPVIATDAGGAAETVDHDRNGLLTPPGDVEALASAMRRLARDPELRGRLAGAARTRAQDFWPERIVPSVVGVYESMTW